MKTYTVQKFDDESVMLCCHGSSCGCNIIKRNELDSNIQAVEKSGYVPKNGVGYSIDSACNVVPKE